MVNSSSSFCCFRASGSMYCNTRCWCRKLDSYPWQERTSVAGNSRHLWSNEQGIFACSLLSHCHQIQDYHRISSIWILTCAHHSENFEAEVFLFASTERFRSIQTFVDTFLWFKMTDENINKSYGLDCKSSSLNFKSYLSERANAGLWNVVSNLQPCR